VTIFSYDQFQLISLFINDFSIMTNNDVDRAKVCLSIILLQKCKKEKKNVDGLHLQVNILHKK